MKKLLALLLAMVFAFSMVACAKKATDTTSDGSTPAVSEAAPTTAPTAAPTAAPTPAEPKYDFGGMEVTLAWPWAPKYQDPGDETDRFNARVAEVEKKLNIKFKWVAIDGGEYWDNMVANTLAGKDYGTLMFVQPWVLPSFISAGIVADVKTIADSLGLDMTDPSWNAITAKMSTYDGIQYTFDKSDIEVNGGVIFNKRLLEEAGLKSPYDCVKDGTWTWDTFEQYAKALTKVGADGTVSQYGLSSMTPENIADLLVLSNNGDVVDGTTNPPTVTADSENTLEALTKYQQLVAVDKVVRMGDPNDWESNVKAYAEGNVAMFLGEQWVIDYINTLNPEEFGFVYFPMGPKATDYVSTAGYFNYWIPSNIPLEQQQASLLAYSMIFDNLYPEMSKEDYFTTMAEKYANDEEGAAIYADIQLRGLFKASYANRFGIDNLGFYRLLDTTDYTPQSAVSEQKPVMESAISDFLAAQKGQQ